MPFSTLRKLFCSYYDEKRKIRPKNLVGQKCSAVIIMSVFYPLNRQRSDYIRPTDSIYPILWGKNEQGFYQFIPNWLEVAKQLEKVRKYILTAWKPILMFRQWCIS